MLTSYVTRRTALAAATAFALASSLGGRRTAMAQAQAPELQSPKAKQVEVLVNRAAALVAAKGRAALDEFRQRGSEWFNGDIYVFVDDLKGNVILNPASPRFEGTNVLDLKDKNGKYLQKALIEVAETQGAGWVDYMWPKPGTDTPVKKWSYLKRIDLDGTPALLGVGIYLE